MKKITTNSKITDELRPEYDFKYTQSRPNRFAPRMKGTVVTVVLDPDVAAVFDSAKSVNKLLRSVISAIPKFSRKGKTLASRRKTG
jgi:hypothetical protein